MNGERFDPTRDHPSHCAVANDCTTRWQDAPKDVKKQVEHRFDRNSNQLESAINQLGQETVTRAQTDLQAQQTNVQTLTANFLAQSRERFTAWGCNATCI